MPIDELEATLDRLQAENRRPKFIYTIPNFQNPGGVTMSLERRRRLVQIARERELLVLEDNPYGLLRYEGEPLPTLYSLDAANSGRERQVGLRHLPGNLLEDPLPGHSPRLGGRAAAGAGEAQPRQTGRRPLLVLDDAAVRGERTSPSTTGAGICERAARPLPAPARRDAAGARASTSAAEASWTQAAGRAVHLGDAAAVHRHHQPAGPVRGRGVRARARRVHGSRRAAGLLLDAPELRGAARGGDPRGDPADRAAVHERQMRAVRRAHRIATPAALARRRAGSAGAPHDPTRRPGRELAGSRRAAHDATRRASRAATKGLADVRRAAAPASRADDEGRGAQGRALAGARRVAALGERTCRRRCDALGTR